MRQPFLLFTFAFLLSAANGQSANDIIAELKAINQSVAANPCNADSTAAISHRAMNVFLADKTGYLAGRNDLSFFTNYVALNTSEARISVNHNFQQAGGADNPIKGLLYIGVDMTLANAYSKGFTDTRFENELGLSVGYKWLSKVKTRFADCNTYSSQKTRMDILRSNILLSLQADFNRKEKEFITVLDSLAQHILPGQVPDSVSAIAARYHYAEMKDWYEEAFVTRQAALLTQTKNFKRISTGWTSITAYIPVVTPKYRIAESFNGVFQTHHPYAFNLLLSHTRFWESSKAGRLFVTVSGNLLLNNSKLGYGLSKVSAAEYAALSSTGSTTDVGNNRIYIGRYKTLITPSAILRTVYFPADSHIGISILAEQHFGIFNPFDLKLGLPIVLINHQKTPAVNIEFYWMLFDLGKTNSRLNNTDNTALGLSVGIPLSRLMY